MSPEQWIAILGALTALIVAVGAVFAQVIQLRRAVDGRLTQLLEVTGAAQLAAGHAAGVKEASTLAPLPTKEPMP